MRVMGSGSIRSNVADFRIRSVSGYKTELLEVRADGPALHVVFIPGNPGMAMYYKNFVESLYEHMDGRVSITAVGHLSHSKEDWENGRLFSLQEQIDHKIDFIREDMQNIKVPMLLVGHSIGSYISLEIFQRSTAEVSYCIGLYPFLTLNLESLKQSLIKNITQTTSSFSSSSSYISKYHTMRNVFFMAMTEFQKSATGYKTTLDEPNWAFMRAHRQELAFLFGIDDHRGPLQM